MKNIGEKTIGVLPLTPTGTNSTMFTECCRIAICDDQIKCPQCGELVIGGDADTPHETGIIRWKYATAHWRKTL